ncbi:MAG: PHB depolymerase family esterase [Pirellulales bacterium]
MVKLLRRLAIGCTFLHFALTLVIWASCSTAYGQGQVLNKTLQHDGRARSYTLYIPPSYTGSEAWPLVFDLHGASGNASWQMSNAGMNAAANTGNFLVAYPNATVAPGYGFSLWNDGSLFPNGPDDVDFISTMIDELESSYHIDSSRVYATGLSNGGAMSYYLASQLPNRFAAIAAVGAPRPANPTAPRPFPVLHVHGTADSFVPIAGGFMNIPLPGGQYFSTFRVPAINDVIDDWRESNGSVGEPVVTQLPDLNTQDSSTVTLIRYEDGERYLTAAGDERSAEVLYYKIEGGGHTWPGGGMAALFGPTNRDINASAEIWNFFSRHELPGVPVGTWNVDASGNWSLPANWGSGVPNGTGAQAVFGSVITSPHTVTVDAPITVGRLDFENANAYTIAVQNVLTLDAATGDAQINVASGSHTISAPVSLTDNTTLTVTPAASNLSLTGALDASGRNLTKVGDGTLTVSNLRAAGLSVNGGAVAMATNGTNSGVSVLGSLSIAGDATPTAKLDLANNAAIINYTGASPAAMVRQQILTGRGGPGFGAAWTGQGITSSAAAAAVATDPEARSVGYAENSSLPLGRYSTFRGQSVDETSVLMAFTRTGDANLDGIVDDNDVTIVSATYAPGVPQPHWTLGDFDYNGFVDDDDVTLLGVFYDPSAPPLFATAAATAVDVAAVPEPATILLASTAGLLLLLIRRRVHRRHLTVTCGVPILSSSDSPLGAGCNASGQEPSRSFG